MVCYRYNFVKINIHKGINKKPGSLFQTLVKDIIYATVMNNWAKKNVQTRMMSFMEQCGYVGWLVTNESGGRLAKRDEGKERWLWMWAD